LPFVHYFSSAYGSPLPPLVFGLSAVDVPVMALPPSDGLRTNGSVDAMGVGLMS